jgi:uncharacterized membrane protein HdeD (DUF308 family)
MEMLFQEIGKLKRSSIMTSIILMGFGLLMIICPKQYVNALVATLGYGMLVLAMVMVLDFISGKKVLMSYISFTGALLMALLGVAIVAFETDVVKVVGLIFGVVLLGDGIVGIVNAWMYVRRAGRQGWWVLIVLNALMILCGLIVLVNPWWSEPTMLFDVIGGMLLFSSIVSIVRLFWLWPIREA